MSVDGTESVPITVSGKVGLVIFDAQAGQRISLKVVPGPLSMVTMYRPNLSKMAQRSIGVATALLEPPLLPLTGTYSILVDPANTATGTTSLTLYDVPPDTVGPITADGTPASVTTTVPGQNGWLNFSGQDGQRVSVHISSGPLGSVKLQQPDGTTLASQSIGALAAFIDTLVLGVEGTHSLFVDYLEANMGTVTLTLYTVPPDVTGTITAGGAGVQVSITTPGQNGELTFDGLEDQRVSLNVSSGPIGVVRLKRPDGSVIASTTTGVATAFIEPQALAASDTHSIFIDPLNANTGNLTLTLYDVPDDVTGTLVVNDPAVPVTITTPGQNAALAFAGTQSQQVTVRLTSNTIGNTTVRLLKPDGSALTSATSISSNFNLSTQTLPVTGTYTVLVDPFKANTGSINVQVTSP